MDVERPRQELENGSIQRDTETPTVEMGTDKPVDVTPRQTGAEGGVVVSAQSEASSCSAINAPVPKIYIEIAKRLERGEFPWVLPSELPQTAEFETAELDAEKVLDVARSLDPTVIQARMDSEYASFRSMRPADENSMAESLSRAMWARAAYYRVLRALLNERKIAVPHVFVPELPLTEIPDTETFRVAKIYSCVGREQAEIIAARTQAQ